MIFEKKWLIFLTGLKILPAPAEAQAGCHFSCSTTLEPGFSEARSRFGRARQKYWLFGP